MKKFVKPSFEVVRFHNDIISNSNYCYCYDGEDDWGQGQNDCTRDTAFCTCIINHIAGTMNCTPCATNQN